MIFSSDDVYEHGGNSNVKLNSDYYKKIQKCANVRFDHNLRMYLEDNEYENDYKTKKSVLNFIEKLKIVDKNTFYMYPVNTPNVNKQEIKVESFEDDKYYFVILNMKSINAKDIVLSPTIFIQPK